MHAIMLALALLGDCPVEIGEITTQGYDRSLVRRVANAHLDELCRCVMVEGAAARESVLIRYVLAPSGQVAAANVEDTTTATMNAECMADVITTWTFPSGHLCGYAIIEQRIDLEY